MLVTEQNVAACLERCARSKDLAIDLETTGLRTWHGDKIAGIAVDDMYFPFRHGEGPNLPEAHLTNLLRILEHTETLLNHNLIRFDVPMMANEAGGFSPKGKLEDTMTAALLMNENEETFALKALAQKYLGMPPSEETALLEQLERMGYRGKQAKGEMWRLKAADVEPYACGDTLRARKLRDLYVTGLRDWNVYGLWGEMNDYARLLSRMERAGLAVDQDLVREFMAEADVMEADCLAQLQAAAGFALNPNSPKQVCNWLGLKSSNKKALKRANSPHAELLKTYRQLTKVKGTYYLPLLELVDEFGILHPQLNLTRDPSDVGGTRTGRLSCSKPNFQALPKGNDVYKVRACIKPQHGRRFAEFDYERAEVWMAGSYCHDAAIRKAYFENEDLYVEMAAVCGITRQEAKILFLMIQYGAGAWKIAETFGWTEQEAWDIRAKFHRRFPRIKQAMQALSNRAEGTGCIRLFTGRVRHFDGVKSKFYTGWNALIQGSVGEMVRLAMQRLESMLDKYDAEMKLQIHDSILIEYPSAAEREVLSETKRIMEAFDQWPLRPRVDIKTGDDFGHMEPYDMKEAA